MKAIEVVAAIIRKGDAIFATQRGYGEWKDYWEAPGGKVEPGESPIQALRREIREELDTEISVDKFLTTIEWDYPKFHLTMHCYMCSLLNDALHLNEHEAARWLRADELRSVNWLPADNQLLPLIERELEATSQDLARARAFIDSHEWHFAKTMPQIPHWYCLRKDKGDVVARVPREKNKELGALLDSFSVPNQEANRQKGAAAAKRRKQIELKHKAEKAVAKLGLKKPYRHDKTYA